MKLLLWLLLLGGCASDGAQRIAASTTVGVGQSTMDWGANSGREDTETVSAWVTVQPFAGLETDRTSLEHRALVLAALDLPTSQEPVGSTLPLEAPEVKVEAPPQNGASLGDVPPEAWTAIGTVLAALLGWLGYKQRARIQGAIEGMKNPKQKE